MPPNRDDFRHTCPIDHGPKAANCCYVIPGQPLDISILSIIKKCRFGIVSDMYRLYKIFNRLKGVGLCQIYYKQHKRRKEGEWNDRLQEWK